MGPVVALGGTALDGLISQRRVWRGQTVAAAPTSLQPTGWAELDAALPTGGWPDAALSEVLLPADGVGELQLLWPTLARLSQPRDAVIVLVAPPYRPYPPAWHAAGLRLDALQVVEPRTPRDALWAAEQCLRSGACSAVLCWPKQADDRALRRLQVAAETGQVLGFAFRPLKAAVNPSPAALRIAIDTRPRQLRVLKCRGGLAPVRPIAFPCADDHRGPGSPVADAAGIRPMPNLAKTRVPGAIPPEPILPEPTRLAPGSQNGPPPATPPPTQPTRPVPSGHEEARVVAFASRSPRPARKTTAQLPLGLESTPTVPALHEVPAGNP